MRRTINSRILGLLLVGAAVLAVACTPGGAGSTTPPGVPSGNPGQRTTTPASLVPSQTVKGGYGY